MQYNAFRQTQGRMVAIMAHLNAKKLFPLFLALALCLTSVNALACTAVYVGSDLTADGTTMFARSEDISNSYNKLFYAIPAGVHTAGEVYNGCYGFTYTFTKDSYAYTAFRDDNGAAKDGVCPDCGQTHAHTPYEAGGTNSMGVSVSETTPEQRMAVMMTTANSRNSRPTMPPMNSTGMKTAAREMVMETMVKPISAEPS